MTFRTSLISTAVVAMCFGGCAGHRGAESLVPAQRAAAVRQFRVFGTRSAATAPPSSDTSRLLLVSFSTPLLRDLSVREVDAINRSPYQGVAVELRGPADTSHRTEVQLDSAVARIKAHTTKQIWPWIFINRMIGTSRDGIPPESPSMAQAGFGHIQGLDLWNRAGALNDFYSEWSLALKTARALGSPGIIVDHEAYNNYRSYNVDYVARKSGRSPSEVITQLEAIGAHLADITNAEYPAAVIWFLSSGLVSADQSGAYRQRASSYIVLGMLERAKQTRASWTLVAGGEGSLYYCFLSLTDLQAIIAQRARDFEPLLASYPQLALAGTIAPWALASERTDWLRQGRCGRSSLTTIDDFVPLFHELLTQYRYVWIYAAKVAPYEPYDSVNASPYNTALRAARP